MTKLALDEIKNCLSQNYWVAPMICYEVKNEMAKKLKLNISSANSLSLTYLSAKIYRDKDRDCFLPLHQSTSMTLLTSEASAANYVNFKIIDFFKKGELESCSALENHFKPWIQSFKSFCLNKQIYSFILEFLEFIIILKNVPFRGASHPHFMGSIFLNSNSFYDSTELYNSLIHELAHQELFLINFIDRLVNKEFDYNLIHAPYQGMLRPPIGRLHSLHALYRMIQFNKMTPHPSKNQELFISKFKENLKSFNISEMTEFACYLLSEVYEKFNETL